MNGISKVLASCCLLVVALHGHTAVSAHSARARARAFDDVESPVVKTNSGPIRGYQKVVLGKSLDHYLGVPFAQPPVGQLRFKKPLPAEPWTDVLDANSLPNSCQQELMDFGEEYKEFANLINPLTPFSEDCLYLNLFVPASTRQSNNATVLIWIHGGGYLMGSTAVALYDASVLAVANDVIVVSINYRLGVFGFLNLGHEEAPGNMGLFDQALAIKWVKDNIHHFGGNPNSITLFGESAGAGSVSAHVLSPFSRHLFDHAIMESGSVNAPWSFVPATVAHHFTAQMVRAVGCNPSLEPSAVMDCMRNVDARNITLTQQMNQYTLFWIPTVDGEFFPSSPEQLLKEGNFTGKKILIGNNKDEGTMFLGFNFRKEFKLLEPTEVSEEQFSDKIDKLLMLLSPLERRAIKIRYTDWERSFKDAGFHRQKLLSDAFGDYFFVCPSNEFAEKVAHGGADVFYYHFDHRSSKSFWGDWFGVPHGAEIEFVFGQPLVPSMNYTKEERELSRRMMNHFVTFAATGKPAPPEVWPTYSRENPVFSYMNADPDVTIGHGPRATHCAFWNELIPAMKEHRCVEKQCQCTAPEAEKHA